LKLALKLTYVNGSTVVVKTQPSDVVAFERHFSTSFTAALGTGAPSMEHITWLAWHSEHRRKQTSLDFESWLDTLEEMPEEDAGGADAPLPPAP
jgi:hypothetical protein